MPEHSVLASWCSLGGQVKCFIPALCSWNHTIPDSCCSALVLASQDHEMEISQYHTAVISNQIKSVHCNSCGKMLIQTALSSCSCFELVITLVSNRQNAAVKKWYGWWVWFCSKDQSGMLVQHLAETIVLHCDLFFLYPSPLLHCKLEKVLHGIHVHLIDFVHNVELKNNHILTLWKESFSMDKEDHMEENSLLAGESIQLSRSTQQNTLYTELFIYIIIIINFFLQRKVR